MRFAAGRFNKPVYINPFILNLTRSLGPGAYLEPLATDHRLQANTRFVLGPDLNFFPRILYFQFIYVILKFFLKAACSSGEALLVWVRRGTCADQPNRTSQRHPVAACTLRLSFLLIHVATLGPVHKP